MLRFRSLAKHIIIVLLGGTTPNSSLLAQELDSTFNKLTFSGYIEGYWGYDLTNDAQKNRPPFLYSFTSTQQPNINLALVRGNYDRKNIRLNIGFMTGSYAINNLAAEPGLWKHVFELNAGLKLSKQKNLWLDFGVFPSHIGFESAIGKDCWTLTRSVVADNTPYFETGGKITYVSDNGKWLFSALVLNGWQKIVRTPGNRSIAVGHQISYNPNDKITINSSSFIGNDKPDTAKQTRLYHNLYAILQLNQSIGLTIGFDIGIQQLLINRRRYDTWLAPIAVARFKLNNASTIATRVEYYNDPAGVMINHHLRLGNRVWGSSINHDLRIRKKCLWRVEVRQLYYSAAEKLNRTMLTTSIAFSF